MIIQLFIRERSLSDYVNFEVVWAVFLPNLSIATEQFEHIK